MTRVQTTMKTFGTSAQRIAKYQSRCAREGSVWIVGSRTRALDSALTDRYSGGRYSSFHSALLRWWRFGTTDEVDIAEGTSEFGGQIR